MACLNIREPRKVLGCCPGNLISNARTGQRINHLVSKLSACLGEQLLIDRQRRAALFL